ncbi:hypothetical protein WH356_21330 [Ochrobactrum sp. MYb379]
MTRDQSGKEEKPVQKSSHRNVGVYLIAFIIISIDIGLVAWVLSAYVY